MPDTIIKLHERYLESLDSIGFAIQHFPDYHASDVSVLHGHDILEINYIAGGSALHRIGDMKKVCSPGSLGIIHYGQKHNLSCPDGADVINLYLDTVNHKLPDVPAKFADVIRTLFPPSDLPGMPPGLSSFLHFGDHSHMTALLLYCCREQCLKHPGYEALLESGLRMFLIACARQAIADGVETMAADLSRWRLLEGIRIKLSREFASPHRLGDLAAEAGVSQEHLCRRYKDYTGLTPFAYLAQCRIRAAMQMLRNTDRKVLDIALSVGFNDIGHFNRKFKQITNCSPRQYRSH